MKKKLFLCTSIKYCDINFVKVKKFMSNEGKQEECLNWNIFLVFLVLKRK